MASVSVPRFASPSPSSSSPYSSSSSYTGRSLSPCSSWTFRSSYSLRHTPIACRCQSEGSDEGRGGWDSFLHDAVKAARRRWDNCVETFRRKSLSSNSSSSQSQDDKSRHSASGKAEGGREPCVDWDWERWKQHFQQVEERERLDSILKSQLHDAVCREDYDDAAKLKRAISVVAASDTVGNAIKYLNKAVAEEHYDNAASIRDYAGAGLIGWWAGISEDPADPYGRIIKISAEHGRYVARSYSSRQLAAGKHGFPVFEVYITIGNDGNYKQQAVYLKRSTKNSKKKPMSLSKSLDDGSLAPSVKSTLGGKNVHVESNKDVEESDDESQVDDGIAGIGNALEDMIPGIKVKILKVVAPGKVDRDVISNVVEQIMEDEEEDDDKGSDLDILDTDNELTSESDFEELTITSEYASVEPNEESGDLSLNFFIGGIVQNFSLDMPPKHVVRVPARLEKTGNFSFSFTIQDNEIVYDEKECDSEKAANHSTTRRADLIMSDLAKILVSKEKVPLKVVKDVGELIKLTVNQNQNRQPLHGTMFFNRIEMPATSDPLSGLYVSAHSMLTTDVLYLRRKFGQWHDDDKKEKSTKLEFYEYVEAHTLIGDTSIPAGQVAFRAKVGKRNQLPHKGIIPEEFGVVARYKGQGRLAEPGFQNSRWVDGELIILDGKYIIGGPVIGFVYWAPEYHFLKFFSRLKLQE